MLVAIHQPNFLPWLGFFDKIARANRFILLDTVAMQHTGSNYTNRVQVLVQGRAQWITVPTLRDGDLRSRIDRVRIAENSVWRRKLLATLRQSYAKARYFEMVMAALEPVLTAETESLCTLNIAGINAICGLLGLEGRRLLRASAVDADGSATELLVSLVRSVGGDTYLAGGGAGGYQDDRKFVDAGIGVRYQNYKPVAYPQSGVREFVPGLSAVDALMHCGPDAARLLGQPAVPEEGA